jgi:hypothetical protein
MGRGSGRPRRRALFMFFTKVALMAIKRTRQVLAIRAPLALSDKKHRSLQAFEVGCATRHPALVAGGRDHETNASAVSTSRQPLSLASAWPRSVILRGSDCNRDGCEKVCRRQAAGLDRQCPGRRAGCHDRMLRLRPLTRFSRFDSVASARSHRAGPGQAREASRGPSWSRIHA